MSHDPLTHKISLDEIGVGHAETCVRLGKNDPTRERLCECIGIYRHVVVNIFFATCMYTVMYSVCKHKGPIQWDTEDQYTGTKCTCKGPIIWAYGGDTMHVQKNNPIGTQGTCVYKGPTLLGSDAQIEDQSYEHTMHVQSSNPMGRYTYVCTCESFMSGTKNHLYGKPSLHKEELL